jgi:hypothetical protein
MPLGDIYNIRREFEMRINAAKTGCRFSVGNAVKGRTGQQLSLPADQFALVVNGIDLLHNMKPGGLAATNVHEVAIIMQPLSGGGHSTVSPIAVRRPWRVLPALPRPCAVLRRKDRYVTQPRDFMRSGDGLCHRQTPLKSKGLRRASVAGAGLSDFASRARSRGRRRHHRIRHGGPLRDGAVRAFA